MRRNTKKLEKERVGREENKKERKEERKKERKKRYGERKREGGRELYECFTANFRFRIS